MEHRWGRPFERDREKAKSLKCFFHLLWTLISESESSQTTPASKEGSGHEQGRGPRGSSPGLRDDGALPGRVPDGQEGEAGAGSDFKHPAQPRFPRGTEPAARRNRNAVG